MNEYRITLRNDKLKSYRMISVICIVTNVLVFLFYAFSATDTTTIGSCIACAILIILGFIANASLQKKIPRRIIGYHFFFILVAIQWIVLSHYEMVVAALLFGILSAITTRKLDVLVNKEHISYPSFPKKLLSWEETSNVILKDGLLTIDLKNDRLFQQMSDPQQSSVNEQEFNEFCRLRLNAATL